MILQLYTSLTFKCSHLLSNVVLFNAVISLDYELPNDLHEMRLVDCNFLKLNYISHIMKCVSFTADKALPRLAIVQTVEIYIFS